MKKSFLFFSLIVLIVIIAVFTNPDQERHREVMKNKVNTAMQKSLSQNEEKITAGHAIGALLGGFFIDNVIDHMVTADNYVLFSITKVTMDGETRTVGIGIFGNVFVTKQIDDFLEEAFLEETV